MFEGETPSVVTDNFKLYLRLSPYSHFIVESKKPKSNTDYAADITTRPQWKSDKRQVVFIGRQTVSVYLSNTELFAAATQQFQFS